MAASLEPYDGLVFEAHSTDYQRPESLRALVDHGFGFLKDGPELTFAFREAVVALAHVEPYLVSEGEASHVIAVTLQEMGRHPEYWHKHYQCNRR